MRARGNKRGFSLYEILVAVGILALVAVLAAPQVQKAGFRSKLETEKANIALIQEAKEAYAADNPGMELTNSSDLLAYLPDQQMPQSPFGTEYKNLTDLSKPVTSGSSDVPAPKENNFVDIAKSEASGYTGLDGSGATTPIIALNVPTPTPTSPLVTPTPTIPTPVPNTAPSVLFSASPSTVYRGELVTLKAGGSDVDGDPLSYNFTASGKSVYSGPNNTLGLQFPSLGVQPLGVTVSDGRGGSASASASVEIRNRVPTVSLAQSLTNTFRGNSVKFTATGLDGDNDPITYQFKINEDTPLAAGPGSILDQAFTKLGTQKVSVTVNDGFGGLASAQAEVNITNRPPTLSLSANPTSIYRNGAVSFTATAADPDKDPLSYTYWVEGTKLAPSSNPNLSRTFSTLGAKNVAVYVTDGLGGEIERAVTVNVTNRPPTATLASSATSVYPNNNVTFTTTASDPDSDALSYTYTVDGQKLAKSTNPSVSRSFGSLGTKNVSVFVEDGFGGSVTKTASVNVTEVPNNAPSVTIAASPTSGHRGQSFTFTATGTDRDGDALTYSFNGGAYGTSRTFATSYTTLGNQTVSVRAKDSRGAESSVASATVNITNRTPSVTLAASPTSAVRGQAVTFTATGSDADNDTLQYSFNGGAFGTSRTFTTSYNTLGNHSVSVRARDAHGAISGASSATVNIVNRNPVVTLKANPTSVARNTGATVTLAATGSDADSDALSYQFTIPGEVRAASASNTTTTKANATTTYSVNVNDGKGGTSQASVTVTAVNTAPTVTLTANPTSAVRGQNVTFTATGADANGDSLTYRFRVGSGAWTTASATRSFTTSFSTVGNQTVTVEVNDGQGATAQATSTVSVTNRVPSVTLAANPASAVRGQTVTFTSTGSDADNDTLQYSFNGGAFGTSRTFTTSYNTLGIQKVSVRSKDPYGATSVASSATVKITNRPPSLSLAANPTTVVRGDTVTFIATAEDPDNDSLEYFVNGSNLAFTPVYEDRVFKQAYQEKIKQPYQVMESKRITVMEGRGRSRRPVTKYIKVPVTKYRDVEVTKQRDVTKKVQTGVGFTQVYSTVGRKTIEVAAKDSYGSSSPKQSLSINVINRSPTVSLEVNNGSPSLGQSVVFSAKAFDPDKDSLQYSFNGGPYSSSATHSTSYWTGGRHTVSVKVKDSLGAESTIATASVNVVSTATLKANVVITGASASVGDVVNLSGISTSTQNLGLFQTHHFSFGPKAGWVIESVSGADGYGHDNHKRLYGGWASVYLTGDRVVTIVVKPRPIVYYYNSRVANKRGDVYPAPNLAVYGQSFTAAAAAGGHTWGIGYALEEINWTRKTTEYLPLNQKNFENFLKRGGVNVNNVRIKLVDGEAGRFEATGGGVEFVRMRSGSVQDTSAIMGNKTAKQYGMDEQGQWIRWKSDSGHVWVYWVTKKKVSTFHYSKSKNIVMLDGDSGQYLGVRDVDNRHWIGHFYAGFGMVTGVTIGSDDVEPTAVVTGVDDPYWKTAGSPVAIDLNGNGSLDLLSNGSWQRMPGRSMVSTALRPFKLDGENEKLWEWISNEDGLLVYNPEGKEDLEVTGYELFGNYTFGKKWQHGYEPLATLDEDSNGMLDGKELTSIWVWKDANMDAKVQKGELSTLADYRIERIYVKPSFDKWANPMVEQGARISGIDGDSDTLLSTWDWISYGGLDVDTPLSDNTMENAISSYNVKSDGILDQSHLSFAPAEDGYRVFWTIQPNEFSTNNDEFVLDGLNLNWEGYVLDKDANPIYLSVEAELSEDGKAMEGKTIYKDGKTEYWSAILGGGLPLTILPMD